jgi:hypothetical protein
MMIVSFQIPQQMDLVSPFRSFTIFALGRRLLPLWRWYTAFYPKRRAVGAWHT